MIEKGFAKSNQEPDVVSNELNNNLDEDSN